MLCKHLFLLRGHIPHSLREERLGLDGALHTLKRGPVVHRIILLEQAAGSRRCELESRLGGVEENRGEEESTEEQEEDAGLEGAGGPRWSGLSRERERGLLGHVDVYRLATREVVNGEGEDHLVVVSALNPRNTSHRASPTVTSR